MGCVVAGYKKVSALKGEGPIYYLRSADTDIVMGRN